MFSGGIKGNVDEGVQLKDELIPAAITDTGCERDLNEDRYCVVECKSGLAWIVCDGMGGVTGGELAAQLAIDAMRRDLMANQVQPSDVAVSSALSEANRVIVLRRQNQAFAGMGTTAVVAFFQGPEVAISHVGDSRAYLVRGGVMQQLTVDHTYVQGLVDKGEINIQEALAHPDAHILTRCIGSQPGLDLEIVKLWLWPVDDEEPLDKLVLVTDGLYTLIDDQEIALLVDREDAQTACAKLVELAKARGGYDNITVAIIPLDGQLRSEMPPGFTPIESSDDNEDSNEDGISIKNLSKVTIAALILSCIVVIGIISVFFIVKL
jgi:PPM family protein phosphatase